MKYKKVEILFRWRIAIANKKAPKKTDVLFNRNDLFKGYSLINIDSTVCFQKPKIQEYIPAMIKTIAEVIKTDPDNISIKATTTEKLGFIGREEGISANAVVLIEKAD